VTLDDRCHLVGHMIDKWVDAVTMLFNVGHRYARQRRHLLGRAGHVEIGPTRSTWN